jgi:uncharacterized protein
MQVRDGSAGLHKAWSRVRGDLLDVNVWLALSQPNHSHHGLAQAYWHTTLTQFAQDNIGEAAQAVPAKLYFCRTTVLGMVRLLCQTASAYGQPMSLHDAFSAYERYRLIAEVSFLSEDSMQVDTMLGSLLVAHHELPARLATDVYLAALAGQTALRMVTFDRDFERFDLPNLLVLGKQLPSDA